MIENSSLAAPSSKAAVDAVRKAARGLEAVLIREWVSAMEKAQLESGVFGKSAGAGARSATFHLLLSEALGENEPLGIAGKVAEALTNPEQDETRKNEINKYLSLLGESAPLDVLGVGAQVDLYPADE